MKNRSAADVLATIVSDIETKWGKGVSTMGIGLDLSNAFDRLLVNVACRQMVEQSEKLLNTIKGDVPDSLKLTIHKRTL